MGPSRPVDFFHRPCHTSRSNVSLYPEGGTMWTVSGFWRSWTLGLWLVAVLPLLQGALAGNIPWLNDLVDSDSRAAWWRLAGATFCFQWTQFAAGFFVVRREGPGLAELGLIGPAAGRYRAALGAALVLYAGLLVARHTGVYLPVRLPGDRTPVTAFLPTTTAESVFYLALALSAAVSEEFLYRGFLITALERRGGARWWLSIPVSAVAFGLAHSGWAQRAGELAGRTLLGALFGTLYVGRRSLLLPTLLHFVINGSFLFVSA